MQNATQLSYQAPTTQYGKPPTTKALKGNQTSGLLSH